MTIRPTHPPSLWREGDFVKLWCAQTISAIGSKITFLALPLTAVLVLQATPAEMGYLAMIGALPALLFGLVVGVWVDRWPRRPLLLLADGGRGLLLLVIPLAAWLGLLQMPLLYAVLFLTGTLGLLFGTADQAYLPSLVARERLVDANSKLALSRSAAEIAGPTLAGWLVQAVTAPLAIALDALSFLLSALCLGLIRQPEAAPVRAEPVDHWWRELGAGLRFLLGQRTLLALTAATATVSFFNAALEALYLIYMTRTLALSPAWIGVIFGAGSVGFLIAALFPGRVIVRFGLSPTLIGGLILTALSDFTLPLAGGPQPLVIALLMAAQICFGFGLTFYNIGQVSLRQSITPPHLLGRMNGLAEFAIAGVIPLGALLGGLSGEWVGLRPALLLAAGGELLAVGWLLFSPVAAMRKVEA
jgi:MFS family permease